jgi:hypothetical protein
MAPPRPHPGIGSVVPAHVHAGCTAQVGPGPIGTAWHVPFAEHPAATSNAQAKAPGAEQSESVTHAAPIGGPTVTLPEAPLVHPFPLSQIPVTLPELAPLTAPETEIPPLDTPIPVLPPPLPPDEPAPAAPLAPPS